MGSWELSAGWPVLWEAATGALRTVLKMAVIVVPLMMAVELLRTFHVLDRLSRWMEPGARALGMSREAAFPLVAGTVLGISFGSGLIIDSFREGRITRRDSLLLTAFLAPCHAVFEDTLLFVPLGVNPFYLLGLRLATALVLTLTLAHFWRGPGETPAVTAPRRVTAQHEERDARPDAGRHSDRRAR